MNCDKGRKPEPLPAAAANGTLKFQMKLASDPRLLAVVRAAVGQVSEVLGFEASQCRKITLAVDEALSNVIRHAYRNECDHEIELQCEARENCLEFTFTDCGEPADPSRICSQPLDEVALSGRGTHLIRQIMDEVRYEQVPGRNRLHLKKYRPGAKRQEGTSQ